MVNKNRHILFLDAIAFLDLMILVTHSFTNTFLGLGKSSRCHVMTH